MNKPMRFVLCGLCLWLAFAAPAQAVPAKALLEALQRYAAKEATGEGAERIVKEVGEATVVRVQRAIVRDGGEQSLQRASALVTRHGPDVIRALDNSPAAGAVLRALDDLPAEQASVAVVRLAAGKQGRELAETTGRYGASALRAEVAHPGVGGRFVRALGTNGASLCGQLSKEQAISLGRHVDDIASLPPSQRLRLLDLIQNDKERFFSFVGRFVETNPGKVLFTTAATGLLLAESERILGGDEIVLGPDGTPAVVSKPGLVGRAGRAGGDYVGTPVSAGLAWLMRGAVLLVLLTLLLYAGIKLWSIWRRESRGWGAR